MPAINKVRSSLGKRAPEAEPVLNLSSKVGGGGRADMRAMEMFM